MSRSQILRLRALFARLMEGRAFPFLLVGAVVFSIDAGLMRLAWGAEILPLEWAVRLGYSVGLCCHFLLNRRLTFKASDVSSRMGLRQALLYAMGVIMCYVVTEAIIRYGYAWMGLDPLVWKAVAVSVTMAISFTWMNFVVFRHRVDAEPAVIVKPAPAPVPVINPKFVSHAVQAEDVTAG